MYESLLHRIIREKRDLRNESEYFHILLKYKLDELSEGQLSNVQQKSLKYK